MRNFINSWASGLIVAVIIVTIIELILPENKNKKYVKMVSGIFILFTIISPVIVKFSGNSTVNIEKYSNIFSIENAIKVEETASIVTEKNIMKVYRDNLTRNIKTGIENLNYTVKSLKLEFDDDNNYKDIKGVYIEAENVTLVPEIKIDDVEINVSSDNSVKDSLGEGKLNENDKNIIKEFLNKNYRVNSRNIHIS